MLFFRSLWMVLNLVVVTVLLQFTGLVVALKLTILSECDSLFEKAVY